jgi:hypothetical protein
MGDKYEDRTNSINTHTTEIINTKRTERDAKANKDK